MAPVFDFSDSFFLSPSGPVVISADGQVSFFPGQTFTVNIPQDTFASPPVNITLSLEGILYPFFETPGFWTSPEIMAPSTPGVLPAELTVMYADGGVQTVSFSAIVASYGYVFAVEEGVSVPISGAKVELFLKNPDGGFSLWPAAPQTNPQITDVSGAFGWSVPPGTYSLKVTRDDYSQFETNPVDLKTTNLINNRIELLPKPPPLTVDLQAPLTENVAKVAKNLGKRTTYAARVAGRQAVKIVTNPEVKKASEEVLAPATATVTLANITVTTAVTVGGASQLMNYLRLIFTQPILLLFRRRRREWGVVYNSLTKKPIELAIVRLIDASTGRLVQSRVTDREGRYAFFPPPGRYRLEVTAAQVKFPTTFFATLKEDGVFTDLYHGEEIEVTQKGAALTANIPLDPLGVEKPLGRIIFEVTARKIQASVGISSVFLATAFTLISPTKITGGLLAGQILIYLVMRRFIYPRKPRKWGLVFNNKTRGPLGRAVARIFDTEYNKLLETQITDHKGRYAFLVGRNDYYIIYDKTGFTRKQSEIIKLKEMKQAVDIVGPNIGLEPLPAAGAAPPAPHTLPTAQSAPPTPPPPSA